MSIFEIVATMLTGTGAVSALVTMVFNLIKKENENIKIETDNIKKAIQSQSDNDVFKLIYNSVSELTQYYTISKIQSSRSFILAIVSCILGVVIYIAGFLIVAFFDKDIVIFTTISGTVAEVITGLSFWVYSKCTKQMNEYHKRLNTTEKYLTSIQLADKMNSPDKEEMYKWLIQNAMKFDLDYQLETNKNNKKFKINIPKTAIVSKTF